MLAHLLYDVEVPYQVNVLELHQTFWLDKDTVEPHCQLFVIQVEDVLETLHAGPLVHRDNHGIILAVNGNVAQKVKGSEDVEEVLKTKVFSGHT
jgi:hypothetical protein